MYTPTRNRYSLFITLIVLSLAALVLHQTGQFQPVEDFALGLLEPILGSTLSTRDGIQAATGSFGNVSELRAELQDLQAQVDAMTLDNVRLREVENENKILREQLGYKQANTDFELIGATVLQRVVQPNPDIARVIGVEPSNLVRFVVIDQGIEEGVRVNMPVVTPQGLVGRVTQTGSHWAKVVLIIDPSSSVNAVVQSTRATGVVQGEPTGKLLIKYVPQGEAIKNGDLILTSGLGGNFPKRLVIGEVIDVYKRDNDLFQQGTLRSTVDFARLEFVMVLKKFTPSDITTEPTPTPTPIPKPTATKTPAR